jgi:hypothetical protein
LDAVLAMEIFLVFTLLLAVLHLGGASLIVKHVSGIRNGTALLTAFISAYVSSIALDNIWAPVIGGAALSIIPIIAGTIYGWGFYSAARKLVTRPVVARSAYFVIGILAVFAGFVGHKHNLAVGGSLLLLSIVLPFENQVASAPAAVTPQMQS